MKTQLLYEMENGDFGFNIYKSKVKPPYGVAKPTCRFVMAYPFTLIRLWFADYGRGTPGGLVIAQANIDTSEPALLFGSISGFVRCMELAKSRTPMEYRREYNLAIKYLKSFNRRKKK